MFVAASAQIGSGVDNIAAFGAPRTVTTMILTILCALVVLGGMKNLLSVSERIVPAMSILYILGALVVLALNIQNVPGAFAMIFRYAFTGHAVLGGFGGATVAACIRWGIARGVYSNDAGVGYVTIAHSVAEVNPVSYTHLLLRWFESTSAHFFTGIFVPVNHTPQWRNWQTHRT